jgi:arginine-tRNA-protein transferase
MSDVIPEKREPEIDVRLAARLPESLPIANVLDNEHPCSYLPNRVASLPLVYPRRMISTAEFDHLLENGMRRSGVFMYCTACSGCSACEPSRV